MIADFIKNFKRAIPFLALIALVTYIDQISKSSVMSVTDHNTVIHFLPFLNIINVWNKGVSFGLFQGLCYVNSIFVVINIVVVLILFFLLIFSRSYTHSIIFSLIIGGALGNLLDRFLFGAVYDFLDFHIYEFHWPTFNFADAMIFIGVVLYFIDHFKKVLKNKWE